MFLSNDTAIVATFLAGTRVTIVRSIVSDEVAHCETGIKDTNDNHSNFNIFT